MNFGRKLKYIRQDNNLTQSELASIIGISRSNVANLELSKVRPSSLLINCISLKFNIDIDWLTNDDDNENIGIIPKSIKSEIIENYNKLDNDYKVFIENQIVELLKIQNNTFK